MPKTSRGDQSRDLPTLNQGAALFIASMIGVLAPATVLWYRRRLAPLLAAFGDHRMINLTVDDLRAYRAALAEKNLSPWTLHAHTRAARRLFVWLVQEGRLTDSPAARLELPALPIEPAKGITVADMGRIISAARASPRDYALCLFLADTGARVGGVAGLEVKDLDLASGRAIVREKGSKARTVYLTRRTCKALRDYLGGRRSGRVFLGSRGRAGQPLTTGGIYQALERLAARAGVVGRWNPHSWRHGAARGWLKRGANLAQVSQLLGHSDVSVTVKFYGAFVDEELRAAHKRFTLVEEDDN